MTTPARAPTAAASQPAAGQALAPDGTLTRAGRASQALTGRGSGDTPRRLRLARLVHVLLALLLGLGAVAAGVELNEREATAAVHAAQHQRATRIEASLQYAQENAGDAPADDAALPQKTRKALDTATTELIGMASAGTGDTARLAGVGHLMSRYVEALAAGETAAAESLLETDLLPAVRQLQDEHSAVASAVVTWWMWLVPVGAWLVLATIVGIAWYTARVSHRVVNAGLAVAAVATAVLAIRSAAVLTAHAAGAAGDAGFVVLTVACTFVSTVAGAWGLHQRLKEYR